MLQSIVMPISEFDNELKGDALHGEFLSGASLNLYTTITNA